jgi:MOSC domain-containing protein YiiM
MSREETQQARTIGVLRGIAHRPTDDEPMREAREAVVVIGRGLEVENRKSGRREVTLISAESWADVCRELGVSLPWYTRRANLLIEGMELSVTIGRVIRIGTIEVRIHGESKPCNVMEAQQVGLRDALKPHCRGGVFGEVLVGGTIRVDDKVEVTNHADE